MQMGRVGVRWVVVRLKRNGGGGGEVKKKNTFLPPHPLSQRPKILQIQHGGYD